MKARVKAVFVTIIAGMLILPAAFTDALSCPSIPAPQRFDEAVVVAIVTPLEIIDTDTDSNANTTTWLVAVDTAYKGVETGQTMTIRDVAWPGGIPTLTRLQVNKQFLVYLPANNTMGICDDVRSMSEPLTEQERAVLEGESEFSCDPYVCRDGTVHPACSEDGHMINYFAEPCLTHGGEIGGPVSFFTDVDADHQYYEAISWARTSGVVEGYADGMFRPDATVNRAEFLKILIETKNLTMPVCELGIAYQDVDWSSWYANYLRIAYCLRIATGYSDNTFRPSNSINFAEAAKIVANLHAGQPLQPGVGAWYQVYVDYLKTRYAVPASIRANSQLVTRGEMVEIMYRLQIEEPMFCTSDAMECPDGSWVGRVPPTCEFAACPGQSGDQEAVRDFFINSSSLIFSLIYSDMHPLWGGEEIRLENDRNLTRTRRGSDGKEIESTTLLSTQQRQELRDLLEASEVWEQEEPARAALPDENRAILQLRVTKGETTIWEWFNNLEANNRIKRIRDLLIS